MTEAAKNPSALSRIEHIVVVMLENRSFDHVFGYLSLPNQALPAYSGELPAQVEGLSPGLKNTYNGNDLAPSPLNEAIFAHHRLDPPHDAKSVQKQIANGTMGGFVEAFAEKLKSKKETRGLDTDPNILGVVMQHLMPEQVPVYDHLARNFCICDHWHCSIPGPTMPNRFFAVTGTTGGIVDNGKLLVRKFGKFTSLFQHLQHDWRWYSSDPGILRAIDGKFSFDDSHDHFAYFDECTEVQPRSFLRDVLGDDEHEPDLLAVSWIDPNFAMTHMLPSWASSVWGDGPGSNDDHPPAPTMLGQKLVHKIYTAIGKSKYRDTTMIVVVYDEHGGFFDHEPPPADLGPRVPALIVSPHVKRGVCSTTFEHASLAKTILLRFGAEGSWEQMGPRIAGAQDLSIVLRDDGMVLPFPDVPNAPAEAAIQDRDLVAVRLPNKGSRINHTIAIAELALTELQFVIVYGIALPLRSGRLSLRRIARFPWLKRLLMQLLRIPKPKKRLAPRRP